MQFSLPGLLFYPLPSLGGTLLLILQVSAQALIPGDSGPLTPDQIPQFHALLWSILYSMCYKFNLTSHCTSSCLVSGCPQPNSELLESRRTFSPYSSLNPQCVSSVWHYFALEMSVQGKEESSEKGGMKKRKGVRNSREGR